MNPAKIRVGGAWVDSDLEGDIRVGGLWVPFGPAAGFTDESFTFPTPGAPDWSDSPVNMGCKFTVSTAGSWIGNKVWLSTTAVATEYVFGHNFDNGTQVATPVAISGATRGTFHTQLFGTPVSIISGVNYIAGFYSSRYGYTTPAQGATVPFTTSRMTTASSMGSVAYYLYGAFGTRPTTSSSGFHFNVSPIVRFTP